jgi:hypothetical protein
MGELRDQAPRDVSTPEQGCFALRLVRKGPWVPALIMRDERGWWAMIDGQPSPPHPDPAYAPGVFRIWHGGRRIDESEYRYMMLLRGWATLHMPEHPAANPGKPVDISRHDPII